MEEIIAKILLDAQAVVLNSKRPFTYSSGIKSPVYCDNRILMSFPEKREAIIRAFLDKIKGKEFDVIAGIATAGIPWCTWLAKELNKPMIYVRGKAKEHGKENQIEGKMSKNQKIIVIEDLVSTGSSSIFAIEAIKQAGGVVEDCMAIFTYELDSSIRKFKEVNCNLTTLTNFTTLIKVASEINYIKPEEKSIILSWKENPEEWEKKFVPLNYIELLRKKARETKSIVCVGLDPVLEKIPLKGSPKEVIIKFYLDILDAFIKNNVLPAAVKPNIAFYEQYGLEGLEALQEIAKAYKEKGFIVIVDAKRGDIGKTSEAYAKAMYDFWGFDAATVSPYMGSDSVLPFIGYCEEGRGVYILNKTSNIGAADVQDLKVEDKPLYMKIAEKIINWAKPGTGAVVGATYPKELEEIARVFVNSGKEMPLLIPGVGEQGGSAREVVNALKNAGVDLSLVRINSSSGINYAYLKEGTEDYAGSAVRALKKLNDEIGFLPQ